MSRALVFWTAVLVAGCGRIGFDPPDGVEPASDGGDGDAPPLIPGLGYFVEVPSPEGQAIGGIAGANARCLQDLTGLEWLGKSDAASRGALDAAYVHAWLCTSASCFDLEPSQPYAYASAVHSTEGGMSWVSTPQGFTADDGYAYQEVFGAIAEFREFFTGRDDDNGPAPDTCGEWQLTTGETRIAVSDTPNYTEKRSKYFSPCDAEARLICVVSPR